MGEQCKAKHPTYGVQCERNRHDGAKDVERWTHRAEMPPRPGESYRVVAWQTS